MNQFNCVYKFHTAFTTLSISKNGVFCFIRSSNLPMKLHFQQTFSGLLAIVLNDSAPEEPEIIGYTVPPISLNECDASPHMKQFPFSLPGFTLISTFGCIALRPSISKFEEPPIFNLLLERNSSNRSCKFSQLSGRTFFLTFLSL